jgi:hypothetical protein
VLRDKASAPSMSEIWFRQLRYRPPLVFRVWSKRSCCLLQNCPITLLVWPWSTVHVTVSRQGDLSACEWAWEGFSSIYPVVM